MSYPQSGILADVPKVARFVEFELVAGHTPHDALRALADLSWPDHLVMGLGPAVVAALGASVPGLAPLPVLTGAGVEVPSTPTGLWLRIAGADRGEILHEARQLARLLAPAFVPAHTIDAFMYGPSLDLSGYEDGTENPVEQAAVDAAIVAGAGAGLDGSSFLAVQQWVHNLDAFEAMSQTQRDHTIGRRHSDNEEIDDAPESAHVKRTAQESYSPEAFVVRRSMPWTDGTRNGLVFLSFGHSLDMFNAQMRRMAGLEDGITDALFTFTTPVRGAAFWCPPVTDGHLDLSALGL